MHPSFVNAHLVLNEPRSIYYAGQLLTGSVNCELREQLTLRAINVHFRGWTHVEWQESEVEECNGVSHNKVVTYLGHEEYFNVTQTAFGGGYDSQLPSGKHVLPFQFQIPHKVPSTFNGDRGKITYTVTAYIEHSDPNIKRDEISKEFEIVTPMNLSDPEIKGPCEISFEETLSCCFSSNVLSLTISAPESGYCPGQTIPLTVDSLEGNVEVKKIVIQLIQSETYRSNQPPSEYTAEEVLVTKKIGPIIVDPRRKITCNFVVPDMIAPNMDDCEFIDIGYLIRVKIQLPGCNDDLEDETDIWLGLVPIPGTPGNETYKHPLASDLPTAPVPAPPSVLHVAQHTANANAGYPNPQPGYPNMQPGYPNPQPGYPNQQPGYHNQQPGYPLSQPGYPNQQPGYPNPQPGFPNPQPGFPNQQPGYPNQQPGSIPLNNIGFVQVQPSAPPC